MTENNFTVFIVDDDPSIRKTMKPVLEDAGYRVETFESGEAFLDSYTPDRPGCVVLDLQMTGMTGQEVHEELNQRGWSIPVIFLTGYGTIEVAAKSIRAGAVNFLEKPIYPPDLINHVNEAYEVDCKRRLGQQSAEEKRRLLKLLTPREREILDHVIAGLSSKQIGDTLSISVKTVQLHRARIMKKLHAENVADLVRMVVSD